ncbi:MAG: hypothetical protein DLM69_09605 [Candidatus Chloroheliales bacterium]|nr:MAG: hypothetical protein DLM69_09605 [Chloroflexota bacterium]
MAKEQDDIIIHDIAGVPVTDSSLDQTNVPARQVVPIAPTVGGDVAGPANSLWREAWLRLRRNKVAVGGAIVIILFILVAIFANVIAPYSYERQFTVTEIRAMNMCPAEGRCTAKFMPSSSTFWLGTDNFGRDIFSRVIYGARISLTVGLVSQLLIILIGMPIGLLSGYYGKWIDYLLMRITDVMYAFPTILFAIVVLSVFGQSFLNVLLAIGLTFWPPMARLVRSQVLSVREKEYVEAARAIGTTNRSIILRHILPNILSPVIVSITFGIPFAIMTEAFLSFLNIGTPIPLPSWGSMVAEGKDYLRTVPTLVLYPGIAISLILFAFNFFGDGIRDALDPRTRK